MAVIPAKAHCCAGNFHNARAFTAVIPAKAGIHCHRSAKPFKSSCLASAKMDPGFRWDDDMEGPSQSRISSRHVHLISERPKVAKRHVLFS